MKTTMLIVAGALAGCATAQISPDRMQMSEAVINAAEESIGYEQSAARTYITAARDELDAARQLADRGDRRANLMLARAQVDAELARELAREDTLRREAIDMQQRLKALKSTGGKP